MARTSVLVVDDNEELRDVLALTLEAEGYDVHTAENGRVALAEIERDHPSVLIMDVEMPVMTGRELLAELRARGELPRVVIVMSGTSTEQAWPPRCFFKKPFAIDRLVPRVAEMLDGRVPSDRPSKANALRGPGPPFRA